MKKNRFLIIVLTLVVTISLIPSQAFAASSIGLNTSLVTNVKQIQDNTISFYVHSTLSASSISYKVYHYGGTKRPSHDWYFGNMFGSPVASGIACNNTTVKVTVPMMGNYYIAVTSTLQYDDDYIGVTASTTLYSGKFKWTQTAIDNLRAGNITRELAIAGISKYVSIVCPVCGIPILVLDGVDFLVNNVFVETASYKNIRTTPILNYSWQYKYVPNSSGYTTYLRVFDEKNTLRAEYNIGSVIIQK